MIHLLTIQCLQNTLVCRLLDKLLHKTMVNILFKHISGWIRLNYSRCIPLSGFRHIVLRRIRGMELLTGLNGTCCLWWRNGSRLAPATYDTRQRLRRYILFQPYGSFDTSKSAHFEPQNVLGNAASSHLCSAQR